jgi:opacity protein-like surface antigen
MKKIFLAAVVALLATPLFASDMKFDAKVGYARMEGGVNGFVIGPAMYYSLYNDEAGFIKDVAVGLGLDFNMGKLSGAWVYNLLVGPEARMEMPYSYVKLGFGYDYFRESVGGVTVSSNALGMKFGAGALFKVAEGMKMGLDFTYAEKLTGGTAWTINIGPMVSFDL